MSRFSDEDVRQMREALAQAQAGAALGEVPVGAVLVAEDGEVLGKGFNQPIGSHDATAHAEIVALRAALARLRNYRLPANATLYVTLEPCTMCFGALMHARLTRLVYAVSEPRAGVCESQLRLPEATFYNHRIRVEDGLLADDSRVLLKTFFASRRA